jgi:hypothetical protein
MKPEISGFSVFQSQQIVVPAALPGEDFKAAINGKDPEGQLRAGFTLLSYSKLIKFSFVVIHKLFQLLLASERGDGRVEVSSNQ